MELRIWSNSWDPPTVFPCWEKRPGRVRAGSRALP